MAQSNLVSEVGLFFDWSGGSIKSTRIQGFDETDDSDTQVVTAIGVRGGAGYRDIQGGGSLQMESLREVTPEIPFQRLKDTKEVFAITVQDLGGERWQYQGCRVANVVRKDDDKGSHMNTIKIVFLKKVQLPTPPAGI